MRDFITNIKKLILLPKIAYKKYLFNKNSTYALNPSLTKIGFQSMCVNSTGSKSNIFIGHHCEINGTISANGNNARITIGNYTTIRGNSEIRSVESVYIGNYVIISNNVIINDNNNHPTDPKLRKEMCESGFSSNLWSWNYSEHKPIIINDNVWIGEGSTILKGVVIGEGSIVACRSVVTHNVPPYSIVAGNPAKVVKMLDE